jgi:hypothetical protein
MAFFGDPYGGARQEDDVGRQNVTVAVSVTFGWATSSRSAP